LSKTTQTPETFQDLEFKYLTPRFNLPKFKIYSKQELQLNLNSIKKLYKALNNNIALINEINELSKQDIFV